MSRCRLVPTLWLCLTLGLAAGCEEPRQIQRQIERPPLSLLRGQTGSGPDRGVEPQFREFGELAAGIAPVRPQLPLGGEETPVRTDPYFFPEYENNNNPKTAREVSLPAILSGHMDPLIDHPPGDEDWFTFLVEQDRRGVMDIELVGVTLLDLAFEVHYDAFSGRERLIKVNNQGRGQSERLPNFSLPNGRYYIRVFQEVTEKRPARHDVVRAYQVKLTPKALSASQETEPNDRALTAVPLSLGEQMSGLANRLGDEDWYSVELQEAATHSRLEVELLPPMDTTLELGVYTQARQELLTVKAPEGKRVLIPNVSVLDGNDTYLFLVRATGSTLPKDPYQLLANVHSLDERVELEPNDFASAALRLFWEVPLAGHLSHLGDVDWYRLEPNHDWGGLAGDGKRPPALNLVLSGVPGLDVVLGLYEADGETPIATYDLGGKGDGEEVPNIAVPQRPMQLRVSAKSGANSGATYLLQARAVPTDDMEWEPNNTPDSPCTIDTMGDKLLGYLSPLGDRDCLRFTPPDLTLQFKAPPKARVKVSAYDPNGLLYFQRTTDESLKIPGTTGPLTLCLELTADTERAPKAPYILTRTDDAPEG